MRAIARVGRFSGLLCAVLVLIQCTGRAPKSSSEKVGEFSDTSTNFTHVIIDPDPPSQSKCCLDVVAVGDLDGDGFADVMVGSERAAGLVWYHYPSWKRYAIGAGDFTTDGEIVDLDRDGDLDVLISCISRESIEWWENTGNPFAQESWVRHKIGDGVAHDLAVGDLNGDQRVDVAMFRKEKLNQLAWFESPADPRQEWTARQVDAAPGEGLDVSDLDSDGDLDLVAGRKWFENVNGSALSWKSHSITSSWGDDCRDVVADMNGDGRLDVVLSHSEGKGRVSWFENPSWTEHPIDVRDLQGVHSLDVGDLDGDGDMDVLAGEMHSSPNKRVLLYENLGRGLTWNLVTLAKTGTHNALLADIGGDNDLDIVGKNFEGPKLLEMWENSRADWTYIQVDESRPARAFGLSFGDLTGDGFKDIASGPFFYRNPGTDMTGAWTRISLPLDADAMLITDVDGDAFGDIIAEKLPDIFWFEAADIQGSSWKTVSIGAMPATEHGNGQGYLLAQIVADGKPEIVLTSGEGIFYFQIPADPARGNWPRVQITSESSEEGIAAGDLDRDGDVDIAAGIGQSLVAWWENPGDQMSAWTKHEIGSTTPYADRFAVADINQDGRLDIVVSEERTSLAADANVYWFEQPLDVRASAWARHSIVTQFTTNSMDVADIDGDGDVDVITGEHRGSKKLAIWRNVNRGTSWVENIVSRGKESHLGARVEDLDGDGDLDIASIAWDEFRFLHVWRNNATRSKTPKVATLTSGAERLTSFKR